MKRSRQERNFQEFTRARQCKYGNIVLPCSRAALSKSASKFGRFSYPINYISHPLCWLEYHIPEEPRHGSHHHTTAKLQTRATAHCGDKAQREYVTPPVLCRTHLQLPSHISSSSSPITRPGPLSRHRAHYLRREVASSAQAYRVSESTAGAAHIPQNWMESWYTMGKKTMRRRRRIVRRARNDELLLQRVFSSSENRWMKPRRVAVCSTSKGGERKLDAGMRWWGLRVKMKPGERERERPNLWRARAQRENNCEFFFLFFLRLVEWIVLFWGLDLSRGDSCSVRGVVDCCATYFNLLRN